MTKKKQTKKRETVIKCFTDFQRRSKKKRTLNEAYIAYEKYRRLHK